MPYIESLDQELVAGGTIHDYVGFNCPGGQKPGPLKSSWHLHDRVPPPPRKEKHIFFIDRGGITVAQAGTLEQAYACILDLGNGRDLTIRTYTITEESLQEEERLRREKRQLGY